MRVTRRGAAAVPGGRRTRTWTVDGERWSLPKLLGRLVWHELLHVEQFDRQVPKVAADTA